MFDYLGHAYTFSLPPFKNLTVTVNLKTTINCQRLDPDSCRCLNWESLLEWSGNNKPMSENVCPEFKSMCPVAQKNYLSFKNLVLHTTAGDLD